MRERWGVQVVVRWGDQIVAADFVRAGRGFSIGTGDGADVAADPAVAGVDQFDVLAPDASTWILRFSDEMRPRLFRHGDPLRVSNATAEGNGCYRLRLTETDSAQLQIGTLSLELKVAPPPEDNSRGLASLLDRRFLACLALAIATSGMGMWADSGVRSEDVPEYALNEDQRDFARRVLFGLPPLWHSDDVTFTCLCHFGSSGSSCSSCGPPTTRTVRRTDLLRDPAWRVNALNVPEVPSAEAFVPRVPSGVESPEVFLDREYDVIPEGGIEEPKLSLAVGNALARFRACYGERLRAAPRLCAQLTLQFSISTDGSPEDGYIAHHGDRDPVLEKCVLGALAETRFPEPLDGRVSLSVPLRFARYVRTGTGK